MKRNLRSWILCLPTAALLLTIVTACSAPSPENPASSEDANVSTTSSETTTAGTPESKVSSKSSTTSTSESTVSSESPTASIPEPAVSTVTVDYALREESVEPVILSSSASDCLLCFTADGPVSDFTLLDLTLEDVSDDGIPTFSASPAVDPARTLLSPETPVIVSIPLWGTLPSYGISYRDNQGNLHGFALILSGYDGTILLQKGTLAQTTFVLNGI